MDRIYSLRGTLAILTMIAVLAGPLEWRALASEPSHGAASGSGDIVRYFEFDSMTVTIYRNDTPAGQLTTRLTIQVVSSEAYAAVRASHLKLRDAMLRELLRIVEREAQNGPKVDIELVKKRMMKVTRRQFGEDMVADVLVQAFLRRGA